MTDKLDLDAIWRDADRAALDDTWATEAASPNTVKALVAELRLMRTLLTHPQARDLLEHHRHLDSGECSCQATYAYGPAEMDRDQWIAHVIDDAKTRGIV